MGVYTGTGLPLVNYDGLGRPVNVYDGQGRPIGGGGDPLPLPPDYDILQFPDHLSRWWTRYAAADEEVANVLVPSNSIGAGYYANGVASVDWPTMDAQGWVGRTRTELDTRFGPNGDGIMSFGERQGSRVVLTGSPTRRNTFGFGQYGYRLSAGQSIAVTPRPCTGFRVDHLAGTATPTYMVDGTPMTPTVLGTRYSGVEAHIIDGLTLGTHTLTITGPGTGSADVSAYYGRIDTVETGVTVSQSRAPGGYVYDFLLQAGRDGGIDATGDARMKALSLLATDTHLLVLAFGHNEWRSGQVPPRAISPAEYADRLSVVCAYQTDVVGGSAVILAGPDATVLPDSTQTYPQAAYWDASRAVAEANPHVAFIDFRPVFGAHSSPPWVDGVHPGTSMHEAMALHVLDSLFPRAARLAARLAA